MNMLRAVSVMIGTIIGAGMFGIPYAVSRVGVHVGTILIVVLGAVILFLNLAYGEVISRTKVTHQLTGYAEKYLGQKGKLVAFVALMTGLYGGLIAYIIKVGELLNFLVPLSDVTTSFFWSTLFFITMALAVLVGLKLVSNIDTFLTVMLLIAFIVLSFLLYPEIQPANLNYSNIKLDTLFFPYGVILFSLGGATILGEVKSILDNKKQYRRTIIWGTLIPIIIYFLFTVMIIGTTGLNTSDDAIRGLHEINPAFSTLGAVLAILTMTTSFLGLATILKDIYHQDFKIPYFGAWALAVFPAFIIYFLGIDSFITVIGVTGGVMAGLEGIIILLMHQQAKSKGDQFPLYEINFPELMKYFLICIFVLGIVYEVAKVIGTL